MPDPLLFVEDGLGPPAVSPAIRLSLAAMQASPAHLTPTILSPGLQAEAEERAWTLHDEVGAVKVRDAPLRDFFREDGLDVWEVLQFDFYIYFFRQLLTLATLLDQALSREEGAFHGRAATPWQISLLKAAAQAHRRPLVEHPPSTRMRVARIAALVRARDTIRLNQTAPGFVRALYAAAHQAGALRRTPAPPAKGIAGLAYVNNQLDAILPVLAALPARDRPYVAIYDDPLGTVWGALRRALPDRRLPAIRLNRYAARALSPRRAKLLVRAQKQRAAIKGVIAKSGLAHARVEVGPALASIVDQWLFVRGRLAEALQMADTLEAYFAAATPALCLNAVEYTPLGRLWIRMGRRHGVPSLHVPHSLILGQTEHRTIDSDAAALQGEISRELLVKAGTPPEKLHVVGSPKHDALCCRAFKDLELKALLGCPRGVRLVTLATNPISDELNDQLILAVIAACKARPDVFLALKLHPLESGALHRRRVDEAALAQAAVIKHIDLYALLHASVVVVVYYSTVALDAMLLDRPVITANFSGGADRYPYAASGAAAGARSPAEVTATLSEWLARPDADPLREARRAFVQRYFYKTDGQAARRTAELIEKLKKA